MNVNSIGKKISLGFLAMVVTLIVSGLASVRLSAQLADISYNIREIAGPTVTSSLNLLNGVNQTQSSLKSWLLLRDDSYREARADAWHNDINPSLQALGALSKNWRDPEDVKRLIEVKAQLSELQTMQDSLERMKASLGSRAIEQLGGALTPLALSIREKLDVLIQNKNHLVDLDMTLQEGLIRRLGYLQIALIVLGAAVGALMSFLLIRAITLPIQKTIRLADEIAAGNYGAQSEIAGSEEINRLGSALERMRRSLEEKTWLTQSQLSFNERIRLASTPRELADAASAAIADRLPVLAGAVYSAEGESIQSIGGFALSQDRLLGKSFRFGQGLAGQAAAERKILSASGASEGLRLETICGDVVPQEVLAAPLSFKDEIVGVIELSLSAEVNPHEREFLQIATETGAIALGAVRQGEKIKNLLQETQAQAEELQLQQEELKSANEELQTRQEELRATNEELEAQKRALDTKNSELELAQQAVAERAEELDRVSKYKSEFLANMSHELRTPLNSQLVLAKLLSENKGGNLTEKQTEFARTIFATGQDLLKLINDILDLSKVEAGKLDLDICDAGVSEIVGDLKRDFDHVAEQKGLQFEVRIDADVPARIKTDPHRLCQILRNLISNAVKFTSQ
jgi:two-component system chemotaxis sensor kinase CheA